ncbi:hypothetical protein Pgy4_42634 [Pseudomonas savastanoi pv. glycinea str. race 4]|uniref:Uncharacterized protein n=1 Tax=Pseudomonas savastanoi pv. glycinea str. race 4 TaxID=875330 RepID=F3CK86_PSESG|nr:hypothetical protein Pgy4_42634 [Pseudomonas savastanoi pv. glycinea str. race 4]
MDVVRKAMEKDGYRAIGGADVQIRHIQYAGLNLFQRIPPSVKCACISLSA